MGSVCFAKSVSDFHPDVLADIYQDDVAISIWRRQLSPAVTQYANHLLVRTPCFQTRVITPIEKVTQQLNKDLPIAPSREALIADIDFVAQMFACLFELNHIGLRLAVLNKAMCPKFHVDRVPCRLISTYAGAATEWLTHEQVTRLPNGTVEPLATAKPEQLYEGEVALLKGDGWLGNEGRGLVHRSPAVTDNSRRLVLTLDFS